MHFEQNLTSNQLKYVCLLIILGKAGLDSNLNNAHKKKTYGLNYQCNQCDKGYKESP